VPVGFHSLTHEHLNVVNPFEVVGAQTRTSATLLATIAAIVADANPNRGILLPPGVWSITQDVDFPAHIPVRLADQAILDIATGVRVTVRRGWEGPPTQVVTGNGTLVFADHTTTIIPEWFGLVADNATDSQPGMRRLERSLNASPGVTVRFANGTYLMVPDSNFWMLQITQPGITLDCENSHRTAFKMGGPSTFVGQAKAFIQVTAASVTIRNCTFDYNAHRWLTGEALQPYWGIMGEVDSDHLVVENNRFLNNPGTQNIVASGRHAIIRHNQLLNGGRDIVGGNPANPDFTAIYVQGTHAIITDNLIEWDAALGATSGARSGIELHSDAAGLNAGSIIRGNTFVRASLGIRLECDTAGAQLLDTVVAHNVIEAAQIGIFLSSAPGVTTGQCDVRKLDVHDNHVRIRESSVLSPATTGIIGIGASPFSGSNRVVIFHAKIHHNTVELATPAKAYTDNELGIWLGSLYESEVSDNVLVNGTVLRLSSSLFGVREVNVRHNIFTNVVTDFSTAHGLLWLDFTGARVATQGLLVQGNVFTRDPASSAVPNTHAIQIDGTVAAGHGIAFDANYIRNIGAQFIGTLGSTNVFSNTLPFRQRARRGEGR
jgi:hypothetical protein